jgi:hypothetical protein
MTHVWLAQCLCGPNGHSIAGAAGEFENESEAVATLIQQVRDGIDAMLNAPPGERWNPWCGICGARKEGWRIEIGRSRFATIEEATPHIKESELKNIITGMLFGTHGPEPPKKQ